MFTDSYSIYAVHFFSYPWDPPICSTLELSYPILHSTLLFIASYSQPPGKDVRLLIPSYSTVGCKSLIPDPKEEKKERGSHHKKVTVSQLSVCQLSLPLCILYNNNFVISATSCTFKALFYLSWESVGFQDRVVFAWAGDFYARICMRRDKPT